MKDEGITQDFLQHIEQSIRSFKHKLCFLNCWISIKNLELLDINKKQTDILIFSNQE